MAQSFSRTIWKHLRIHLLAFIFIVIASFILAYTYRNQSLSREQMELIAYPQFAFTLITTAFVTIIFRATGFDRDDKVQNDSTAVHQKLDAIQAQLNQLTSLVELPQEE